MGLRTIRLQGFIQFFFIGFMGKLITVGFPHRLGILHHVIMIRNVLAASLAIKYFFHERPLFIVWNCYFVLSIECHHWKQLTLKAALEYNAALGIFSRSFHLG